MNRIEIKEKAKEFAFNNKWNIWSPLLVIYVISFVIGLILGLFGLDSEKGLGAFLTFIFEFALIPLSIGYTYYLIKLVNGKQLEIKEALLAKYKIFGLILIVSILVGIFTTLWSLLLIIPGIIYSLKMTMTTYLLAETEDENTNYKKIMDTSKEMMDGYKWDYFVFGLSFIGWILLCVITLGIAMIWVVPYISVAQVMYYEELKKIKKIK